MHAATFDTHRFVKRLKETGMPENQAEEVIDIVSEVREEAKQELATKGDLKSNSDLLEARLETKIEAGNHTIIKYMLTCFLPVIGLLITILLKH